MNQAIRIIFVWILVCALFPIKKVSCAEPTTTHVEEISCGDAENDARYKLILRRINFHKEEKFKDAIDLFQKYFAEFNDAQRLHVLLEIALNLYWDVYWVRSELLKISVPTFFEMLQQINDISTFLCEQRRFMAAQVLRWGIRKYLVDYFLFYDVTYDKRKALWDTTGDIEETDTSEPSFRSFPFNFTERPRWADKPGPPKEGPKGPCSGPPRPPPLLQEQFPVSRWFPLRKEVERYFCCFIRTKPRRIIAHIGYIRYFE